MNDATYEAEAPPEAPQEEILLEAQAEEPIKIKGRDGVVRDYTLREMDGDDLGRWMNAIHERLSEKKGSKFRGNGHAKTDYRGMHADLISLCLYDADGKRVSKDVIRKWPASLQSTLFKKSQRLNGLDDDAENREGKG